MLFVRFGIIIKTNFLLFNLNKKYKHMLHNHEAHEFSQMCAELKEIINSFLTSNETYIRVQNYVKLANDNLDKLYEVLCDRNCNYLRYKLCNFELYKESLINRNLYEIKLYFINDRSNYDSICFGVDSFIILLDEAGLIKDE